MLFAPTLIITIVYSSAHMVPRVVTNGQSSVNQGRARQAVHTRGRAKGERCQSLDPGRSMPANQVKIGSRDLASDDGRHSAAFRSMEQEGELAPPPDQEASEPRNVGRAKGPGQESCYLETVGAHGRGLDSPAEMFDGQSLARYDVADTSPGLYAHLPAPLAKRGGGMDFLATAEVAALASEIGMKALDLA